MPISKLDNYPHYRGKSLHTAKELRFFNSASLRDTLATMENVTTHDQSVRPARHDLIATLHARPAQWVLALTGGGASAAGELLSVPGGSRTILEIVIPYHAQAVAEFLGHQPNNFCSVATSQAMAWRALDRALWLAPGKQVFGLGCTASLVSDRPKRGDHRVHVSTAGEELLRSWSLILNKGARDRHGEEELARDLVLHAMSQTLGLQAPAEVPLLPQESIEDRVQHAGPWPTAMKKADAVFIAADGQFCPEASWDSAHPWVLVPGAFNPLHSGHLALAALAQRLEGKLAAFELSVTNVDKPELAAEEVRRRLGQFVGQAPVWLTRASRFVDKARLFPGATFIVGADTAARLVALHYYQDDEQRLRQAFDFFRRQGCGFLVAGRVDATGRYVALDDIPMPDEYRDLFRANSGNRDFRMDISSTLLRQRSL